MSRALAYFLKKKAIAQSYNDMLKKYLNFLSSLG